MKKEMTVLVLFILLVGSTFIYIPAPKRETAPNIIWENNPITNKEDDNMGAGTRNDDHLLAQWHFDGDYQDSTGNNNHGQKNGDVHFINGKKGQAAIFDGDGDYVDCGDIDNLDFGLGDSFTVEAWYKTSFSGQQALISKYKRGGSDVGWWLFSNNANDPGVLFKIQATDSSSSYAWLKGTNLNDNVWHHVVGVRNVARDRLILYVDGVEKASVQDATTAGCENTYPLRFGMESDTTVFPFRGAIDEVTIYNRVLNESEIYAHYNNIVYIEQNAFGGSWFDDFDDNSGIESGLGGSPQESDEHTMGLWHFDEGTGNTARDGSPNGNHGTLQNMEEGDWVKGKHRKGLEFDGVDEYILVEDSNSIHLTSAGTLEAWVKHSATSGDQTILHKGTGSSASTYRYMFRVRGPQAGKIQVLFSDSSSEQTAMANTPTNDGNWHHVAISWDSTTIRFYLDGNSDGLVSQTVIPTISTHHLNIGRYEGQNCFNGIIDEIRISDTARTPEEIARNYHSGLVLRNGKVELNCWQYKRTIGITNNGDALSDYQIQVNLTQQNFDYSHVKNNGKDIRFYDQNGAKLNYWIEKWNTNGVSKIWVNVTNIPNGYSQIQMKYGNPTTESESNGDATFYLFDDFEKGIVNNLKWNSAGTISFNNGKIIFSGDPGKLESKRVFGVGSSITALSKKNNARIRVGFGDWGNQNEEIIDECDPLHSGHFFSSDGGNFEQIPITPFDNNWHQYRVDRFSNKNVGWYDNICANSTMVHSIKKPVHFAVWNGNEMEVEWIFVRKIILEPPSISIGNEQHISSPTANMKSIPIIPDEFIFWDVVSITKTEPANTYINVSVINNATNQIIEGFDNLTSRNIDLSSLNNLFITSITLKAYFSSNGSATPSLDSWGVEWTAENAWRDSFTGDSKVAYPHGVDGHTAGYWKFEEGCGDVVRDWSGNGNDGTLKNMEEKDWVDGVRGKALEFDGVDNYIDAGFVLTDASDPLSVSCSFKTNKATGTQQLIEYIDSSGRLLAITLDYDMDCAPIFGQVVKQVYLKILLFQIHPAADIR